MKPLLQSLLTITLILGCSSMTFAAEQKVEEKTASSAALLMVLVPAVLFIVWLGYFTRKSGAMKQGGYMAKAAAQIDRSVEHMNRSMQHMASIEQKMDRINQLLESIDQRLSRKV